MSTLTRAEFVSKLKNSTVDLNKLDGLSNSAKAQLRQADANGDGKVRGTNELNRLWKAVDNFDTNGSRNSVNTSRAPVAQVTEAVAQAAGKPRRALQGGGQADAAEGAAPAGAPRSGSRAANLAYAKRRAVQLGLTITSTTGGRHAPRSYHYQGRAVDVAGSPSAMRQFYREMRQMQPTELFYDPIGSYKKSRGDGGAIGGHGTHVHVAF
jgi:hypothetical protein